MRPGRKRPSSTKQKQARNRVIVEFPPELLFQADEAASETNSTRSQLIREAVRQFSEQLKRTRFEAQLAEGYRANAELDRDLNHEFRFVDAAGLDA